MTRRASLALTACLTIAAMVPAGAAARGLASPVIVSAPGESTQQPQVAVGGPGTAVAAWEDASARDLWVATRRSAGESWGQPVSLAGPVAAAPAVAVDAQGDAFVAWAACDSTTQCHAEASVRPASTGAWQTPVDLSSSDAGNLRLAVDPQGDAVAVWVTTPSGQGLSPSIIEAAVRPAASGTWQPAVPLSASDGHASAPQVAIDGHGDAVVVWEQRSSDYRTANVEATTGRATATAWRAPVDLSAGERSAISAQVAVDPGGDAVAVWNSYPGDIGFGSTTAQSATGDAASGTWHAPASIAPGFVNNVALDAQGDAIAGLGGGTARRQFAQAAFRPAGSTAWQRPMNLSAPDDRPGAAEVAMDARGDAIAVWSAFGSYAPVFATIKPAASPWWEIPVGFLKRPEGPADLQVAADSQGDAVAAWQDQRLESGGPARVVAAVGPIYQPIGLEAAAGSIALAPAADVRPIVSRLSESPHRWRVRGYGGPVTAAARKPPLGITFRLRLNEPARLTFTFTRHRPGRRRDGRCLPTSPQRRAHTSCKRAVTHDRLSLTAHAGINTITYRGLSVDTVGARLLMPGRYTVVVTATNAAGRRSKARTLTFTIVR